MDHSGKPETMELMRNSFHSYLKRVKGLQKKIYQFSTLVDVDACMIVYRPRQGNYRPVLPDTYPENLRDVIRIVKRYLSIPKAERTKKHIDLSNLSGDDGKNKTGDDNSDGIVTVRDNNNKAAGGLEWDDRFDKLSADKIQQLIDSLETKIETIDGKIQFMEDAESPSCITSRISDHGVGAATTTTTTSRGRDTSMHMQPAYVLQPMNSTNGSAMVPTMGFDFRKFGNNGVTTSGSNVSYPMVMPYRMMEVQPGGGNQTEFGNQQGPDTYFVPQVFVQPMATLYIPDLMPGSAYSDA